MVKFNLLIPNTTVKFKMVGLMVKGKNCMTIDLLLVFGQMGKEMDISKVNLKKEYMKLNIKMTLSMDSWHNMYSPGV